VVSGYTLADFIRELVETEDLGAATRDESLKGYPGLVWGNALYIEKVCDVPGVWSGLYSLTLMNDSWVGTELEPAAQRLFDFAVAEGYITFISAEDAVRQIREVLWPDGDEDHQWSPDTIEAVAEIVGKVKQ